MSSLLHPPLSTREIIRMASSELDMQQMRMLAQLSNAERLRLMFDLCDFLRELALNVARQEFPQASESELAARVSQQVQHAYG